MATIERFEDMRIWQQAREMCQWFHHIVKTTPLENDFKLRNQADSSCGSTMDNIAEGFERNGTKEFIQFLSIAKGSAGEFRSQLYRMFDRGYISGPELSKKCKEAETLSKGISAFMNYLSKSENKGWKYNSPPAQ